MFFVATNELLLVVFCFFLLIDRNMRFDLREESVSVGDMRAADFL